MLDSFIDKLNQTQVNLEKSKQMWDKRAEEFNNFSVTNEDFTLKFVEEKMDLKNKSVVDCRFSN